MFKFNRLVCVLLVCSLVGVALAKAVKIKAFDWVHVENPDGDGMAIANYHPGNTNTEITAAITDFLPNTDYYLAVEPGLSGAPVTTNVAGNATTHAFTGFDICITGGVTFTVWRDLNNDGLRQPEEDRAQGFQACP